MFSLFPCNWANPTPKKKKEDIPSSPVISKSPKDGFIDFDLRDEMSKFIPAEEMCLGEDVNQEQMSEVDRLLEELNNTSSEDKLKQTMYKIQTVNKNLIETIQTLENAFIGEGERVGKKELLGLLKQFLIYSQTLESNFKEMVPANYMNLVVDEHAIGMKYIDISSAKILLVQIPEKLYLKEGYKSLEQMMKTLKQSGVIVVAVPESVNLVNIKEEDLKKLDLFRINRIKNKEVE